MKYNNFKIKLKRDNFVEDWGCITLLPYKHNLISVIAVAIRETSKRDQNRSKKQNKQNGTLYVQKYK